MPGLAIFIILLLALEPEIGAESRRRPPRSLRSQNGIILKREKEYSFTSRRLKRTPQQQQIGPEDDHKIFTNKLDNILVEPGATELIPVVSESSSLQPLPLSQSFSSTPDTAQESTTTEPNQPSVPISSVPDLLTSTSPKPDPPSSSSKPDPPSSTSRKRYFPWHPPTSWRPYPPCDPASYSTIPPLLTTTWKPSPSDSTTTGKPSPSMSSSTSELSTGESSTISGRPHPPWEPPTTWKPDHSTPLAMTWRLYMITPGPAALGPYPPWKPPTTWKPSPTLESSSGQPVSIHESSSPEPSTSTTFKTSTWSPVPSPHPQTSSKPDRPWTGGSRAGRRPYPCEPNWTLSNTDKPRPLPNWNPPEKVFKSVLEPEGSAEVRQTNNEENSFAGNDIMDGNCPNCHGMLAAHHELQHPQHRSRLEDTYLRHCNPGEVPDPCINTAYMRCKENKTEKTSYCDCLGRMERAEIRIGKFKGTLWCLVKDGEACTELETKHEDCISGHCEANNLCAQTSYESKASSKYQWHNGHGGFVIAVLLQSLISDIMRF